MTQLLFLPGRGEPKWRDGNETLELYYLFKTFQPEAFRIREPFTGKGRAKKATMARYMSALHDFSPQRFLNELLFALVGASHSAR